MDEKKMLDLLRKQAEEFEPPESLSPDAIEQMLAKQKKEIKEAEPKEKKKEKEGQDMADQKKDTGKHKKKFSYRMIAELGSMAAIFVLGVTVYSQSKQITQLKKPAMTVQQLETETEKAEMGEAKTEAEQTAEKAVKAETEQTTEEAVKAETEQIAEKTVKSRNGADNRESGKGRRMDRNRKQSLQRMQRKLSKMRLSCRKARTQRIR